MDDEILRKNQKEDNCYTQNYETFRDLNGHMWKIPMIAITITGGLLFGIGGDNTDKFIKICLLTFALVSNIGLILVLHRTRYVMQLILEKINQYDIRYKIDSTTGNGLLQKPKFVVKVFSFLLGSASFLCLIMILNLLDIKC
jgi:hypothetical protein